MLIRGADADRDLAAIADLVGRYETHWYGAPEQDADEVAETLNRIADWTVDVRVAAHGDGTLVAAGWRWQGEQDLIVDPSRHGLRPVIDEMLGWLADGPAGELQVLDRDQQLLTATAARGWRHTRSAFELGREVTGDWVLAPPARPPDVDIVTYQPAHAAAVHALIYADAGWAEIAGHQQRERAEWESLFLAPHARPEPPVVAWHEGRPVGAALCRRFADGTGWVNQLAVAHAQRGRGLGRLLLLEALHRLRAAGATRLALGVQAANAGALRLYLDVGLRVEREFRYFAPR